MRKYCLLSYSQNWNTLSGEGNFTTDTFTTDYTFRDYAQQVAEELKVDLWIIITTLSAIYNYVGI
jgi:hypothetical protein